MGRIDIQNFFAEIYALKNSISDNLFSAGCRVGFPKPPPPQNSKKGKPNNYRTLNSATLNLNHFRDNSLIYENIFRYWSNMGSYAKFVIDIVGNPYLIIIMCSGVDGSMSAEGFHSFESENFERKSSWDLTRPFFVSSRPSSIFSSNSGFNSRP